MKNIKEIIDVEIKNKTGRLDKVLTELIPEFSRSYIQKLIKENQVIVDGVPEKANYALNGTEKVTLFIPYEEELEIIAENIPLEIVYEDDDIVIINKASGMVVHPSKGHPNGTLVNALLYHFGKDLSAGTEPIRPGIVHRIDKDTTGLLVIAKNNLAHQKLGAQLSNRLMRRKYIALVNGQIEPTTGVIDVPLSRDPSNRTRFSPDREGKEAITEFSVKERFEEATLLELELKTGRTHQIRVHSEFIGHPIIGDPVYRKGASNYKGQAAKLHDGQYLHAQELELTHPISQEKLSFTTEIPQRFNELIRTFKPL